jgi:hypothetical protein
VPTPSRRRLQVKIYTLAYNLYDGTDGAAAVSKALLDPNAKSSVRSMMRDRQARALTALPSPLVYFGYMFNFATALAGPAFEISEYVTAQSRAAVPATASRFLPALSTLGWGVLFMVGNVLAGIYGFSVDGIYEQVRGTLQLQEGAWDA